MSDRQALTEGANALKEAAVSHKRAAAYHKRRAREANEKLAKLIEKALALGIKIIIQPQGEERKDFHGRQQINRS